MKKNLTLAVFIVAALALPNLSRSHEGSFKDADSIPPFGPHGGRTLKMTRHFAEVAVKTSTVEVYILERDVKTVASDAFGVTLNAAIPGKNATSISLSKKGEGYTGAYSVPTSARRVVFTVNCVLDGKKETGKLQYEPRK